MPDQPQAFDQPIRVLVLGGGAVSAEVLDWLLSEPLVKVVGVYDARADAPALVKARAQGIPVYHDLEQALASCAPCTAMNLTGNEMVDEVAAERLGAGSVIGGVEAQLFWRIVSRWRELKDAFAYQATHDALTRLPNRRMLTELALQEIRHAMRYREPLSIAVLDLDLFKQVNDLYGHAAGDAALVHAASTIRATLRRADIFGRWGGEEFLALFPKTPPEGAVRALGKALASLKDRPLAWKDHQIRLSFSAGVAGGVPEEGDAERRFDQWLAAADRALYQAKQRGRGQVCAA
ncbi:MAG: diguanylate cyclase [Zetaproteobacteria bacterium]|nr:MAG: diguanylate cyclase [Zetaproteobacteria bacterium]